MDPLCHTLVGATLARAGLERLSRRAAFTLILAANAPDVDIVAAFGGTSLGWRRGVTHGLPALILWPFILAGLVWLWDRWRPSGGRKPMRFGGLAIVAAVGVATHPFLDYLNNYGMRWLMPLRDQWYYGDSLFIVDPWLYLFMGLGLWGARRRRLAGAVDPAGPARIALWASVAYVGLMVGSTMAARGIVEVGYPEGVPRFMATAVPGNPLRKQLVVDLGDRYQVGEVRLLPPGVIEGVVVPVGGRWAEAKTALLATKEGRAFLHWARFPVAASTATADEVLVYDLRYSDGSGPSWAAVLVDLSP